MINYHGKSMLILFIPKLLNLLVFFYRIRHRLSYEILQIMYFAFVHSHLCYGIEIYGNTYSTYLSKLCTLNNKILRILLNQPRHTHIQILYAKYNTVTIPDLHTLQILNWVHKFSYHKNKLPHILMKINLTITIILEEKTVCTLSVVILLTV